MQVVLALHVIAMVCWFAGLFYLPRLFVYHAESSELSCQRQFKVMEHKLFYYIMTPSGILTTIFGYILLLHRHAFYMHEMWMHIKLALVFLLWVFHCYCWQLLRSFKKDENEHSGRFYRFFNEVPTVLLLGIIFLVVLNRVPV